MALNYTRQKILAVVGLGYVGLPLALLAARKGYRVIGVDINEEKLDIIRRRQSPFADVRIAEALAETSFEATSNFSAVHGASVVVICVPTPVYDDYRPNLEPIESACHSIAPYLNRGQLVVLESTVNPGVCDEVVRPRLESGSGLSAGSDFYLAHCPERINPGDSSWNVENISRVVGSFGPVGLERALGFYRSILAADVKPMGSLKEAEAVKIVENSFRDINIAFVNELARSFSLLGIDVTRVLEGAATKPFAFMSHFPGCGVGGHCIPVDPYYLIQYAKQNGFNHELLALARRINNGMPAFTVELLAAALKGRGIEPHGAKVAVLGLAYKPEIGDCRESPAFAIIRELERVGITVASFDPFVPDRSTVSSIGQALDGAAAVIVATAHRVFCELEPTEFLKHGVRIVIDGRNCLSKDFFVEAGITYRGIGR